MKRYILTLLLIAAALPADARGKERPASPYKYEINVAWANNPDAMISTLGLYDSPVSGNSLEQIYGNYIGRSVHTGLISADFNIQFKRWFALGAQLNAFALTSTEMSSVTGQITDNFTDYAISLIPYARLTWANRRWMKMYSSFGLGISLNHDAAPEGYHRETENYISGRWQLVPVGITIGKRIYCMGELGVGTEYLGWRAGIGFRF